MTSDYDREVPAAPHEGGPGAGPVLLARVYDPVEAQIIVGKLRSSGIEAFVRHEALSVVYGLTVDGCGQQDIMVRAEDFEEAQAALEVGEEPDGEE
jgi:Putative prokaryotic signal transducing protein